MNSAFVCERMPWDKEWTIRIVLPGLDNGSAIWLEADIRRDTQAEAEAVLVAVIEAVKHIEREV